MKKLWIVLLSLALVAAFSLPASAVDVKFSGSYYVAGEYYSDLDVVDSGEFLGDSYTPGYYYLNPGNGEIEYQDGTYEVGYGGDRSTAFFRQRLRIQTEFVVSPGLSLITRFDALEKIWGDNNWAGGRSNVASRAHDNYGDGTSKEQENIEFEQAYIQYMSKVGLWWIGYAPHDFWGTAFGDSTQTQALVQWILPLNQNFIIGAKYFKTYEGGSSIFNGNRGIDTDDNAYVLVGIYKTEAIETGMKIAYRRLANNRDFFSTGGQYAWQKQGLPPGAEIEGWLLTPYFTGQFGPVKVQAELEYWNGKMEQDDGIPWAAFIPGVAVKDELDMEFLAIYLDAKVDIGPAWVGGRFVYASGNEWDGDDKLEGSDFSRGFEACWGGVDLKQTLILWNEDVTNWVAPNWSLGPGVKNAFFYQIYGGYKWNDFTFTGSFAYAKADETWPGQDDDYGYELDVTATYKITNNLSYMVGAGYLWTGDYFKYNTYFDGKGPSKVDVDDIYMITNKLTLTF